MSTIIWICLVSFLCSTLCQVDGSFDNAIVENLIERFEKKFLNKFDTFDNINTTQSFVNDRLANLESMGYLIISKQRSIENQISSIASKILQSLQGSTIDSCSRAGVNGVYTLQFPAIQVFCDTLTNGGGWLVIQRRTNGETNFNKNWHYYKRGFGTVGSDTEFWLGLDAIHQITNSGDYELRIDVIDESNEHKYAQYSEFNVTAECDGYKLNVEGYSGTAGDAMKVHNNKKFSTYDVDNDSYSINCAEHYQSGWWFNGCSNSNLNGQYIKEAMDSASSGANAMLENRVK